MLDEITRAYKERWLGGLAKRLDGVPPTAVTLLALLWGLMCLAAIWWGAYGTAALFWALNRLADGLDGTLARAQNRQTDWGGYLDILTDYLIYGLVPVVLVAADPQESHWLFLAILLVSYYVNTASWMYLSAILEKRNAGAAHRGEQTTITMPPALIGGTETIAAYFVFLLWPAQLGWWMGIMAGLVFVAAVQRLVWASRYLIE